MACDNKCQRNRSALWATSLCYPKNGTPCEKPLFKNIFAVLDSRLRISDYNMGSGFEEKHKSTTHHPLSISVCKFPFNLIKRMNLAENSILVPHWKVSEIFNNRKEKKKWNPIRMIYSFNIPTNIHIHKIERNSIQTTWLWLKIFAASLLNAVHSVQFYTVTRRVQKAKPFCVTKKTKENWNWNLNNSRV